MAAFAVALQQQLKPCKEEAGSHLAATGKDKPATQDMRMGSLERMQQSRQGAAARRALTPALVALAVSRAAVRLVACTVT